MSRKRETFALRHTREELFDCVEQCRPEDFDGHTEFRLLSAEKKLEWLSQVAEFVATFKGLALSKEKAVDKTLDDGEKGDHVM